MKAVVSNFNHASQLLEHLIDRSEISTTLIVCSTRDDFINQITPTIMALQPHEIPSSQQSNEDDGQTSRPLPHRFLIPTLGLLAASNSIKLAFCPSIDTLRAYLATYVAPPLKREKELDNTAPPNPLLVILDLVLLHHATSEFSVQGLMRTFACAIESTARNHMDLLLCECQDIHDQQNPNRGSRLWNADVPLLSGSVRLGGGESSFAGRTIQVKKIAERWLKFEESDKQNLDFDEEQMVI